VPDPFVSSEQAPSCTSGQAFDRLQKSRRPALRDPSFFLFEHCLWRCGVTQNDRGEEGVKKATSFGLVAVGYGMVVWRVADS